MTTTRISLLCLLVVVVTYSADPIIYSDQSTWGGVCNDPTSKKQSPINVVTTTDPEQCTRVGDHIIKLPEKADSIVVTNADKEYTIQFGFLTSDIEFNVPGKESTPGLAAQLHLHWGDSDTVGSEHTVDDTRYQAEIHMVTGYKDENESVKYAAIGRFFELGADDNPEIAKMITAMKGAADSSARNIANFNLTALYPDTIDKAYAYEGSLTTPGCDEIVWHVVIPETLSISAAQLAELRTLKLGADPSTGSHITENWRELQDLNERTVYCLSSALRVFISPLFAVLVAIFLV